MSGFKSFIYTVFFISLISFSLWFYIQYKKGNEKILIEDAFQAEEYDKILSFYKKLKVKTGKNNQDYLRKCFYKSAALYHTEKSVETIPFFDYLYRVTDNSILKAYSAFYLGQNALSLKNYEDVKKYLGIKEINALSLKFLILAKMALANAYYTTDDFDKASSILVEYLESIKQDVNIKEFIELKTFTAKVNLDKIYSRRITDNSVLYVIKPSDNLVGIAKTYGTTVDLIKKTNSLKSNVIRPNNHLKVINSTFSIIVSKSKNTLIVKENGKYFKEYNIGTGRENTTPTGNFIITGKQAKPTWYKHDGTIIQYGSKENELGTRWMSINYPGYGIHGTWDDNSIGKQSSAGCIRLTNADVEELFTYITEGTSVLITE